MFVVHLGEGDQKLKQDTQGYDLCLDRRVHCRRSVGLDRLTVDKSGSVTYSRRRERRSDTRLLSEFPYLC